jgi:hypothetical protein
MAKTYTIILSDAEDRALNYVSISSEEWIQNAIHSRCRIAIDEMVKDEIERKFALGEEISGSKEEVVLQSPLKSAAERQTELRQEQENYEPLNG